MSSARNILSFLYLTLVWGSGFVVVKIGQQYLPPVLFAALAFDVTALGLLVFVYLRDGEWLPKSRDSWLAVVAIGLFTVTIYNIFFFIGQQGAPSAVGAVILSFIPVITAGLTRLVIPGRRFAIVEVVGLVVGLAGVILIVQPTPEALATGDISRLLILLGAVSNALGSVLVERIDPQVSTPILLAWASPLGAILLHIASIAVVGERYGTVELIVPTFLSVLYFAVMINVLGYLVFFDLLRRTSAFEVSLVNYLLPITAAVVGWLVLDENLGPLTVLGFVVIIAGFVLVKREEVGGFVARSNVLS